jgi:hypothetical protein
MRLIRCLRRYVLAYLAYHDMHKASRLARRASDRLEASGWLPARLTPSRVPVCVRARWRR